MKNKIFYLIGLIIILVVSIILFISIKNLNKDHYSKYVEGNGDIYILVDKQYKKIGKINNIELELENKNDNLYYKIKDTDFYIHNRSIKPITSMNIEQIKYPNFNEEIITKDSFKIYQKEIEKATINQSMTFSYQMKDKKYYYISYLNQIYQIKKDDIKSTNQLENNIIDKIPVLVFSKSTEDSCYNDCLNQKNENLIVNYLKNKQIKTISMEDYLLWNQNKIAFNENVVLILSDKEIDSELISNKVNDNFVINNESSVIGEKQYSSYLINNNTTIGDLENMLNHQKILDKKIDDSSFSTKIPVLNYHFFYDPAKGEQAVCNETICEDINTFEKQLSYLKENGFKTLTMEEFRAWIYNEIELPNKSVLITIDDGAFGTDTHLPRLLDKYQINATLFLITAWWPKEKYVSPYLEIESHGYDIHTAGTCGKGKIICLSKDEAVKDLKKSIEILNSDLSFCYPFYAHNELTKEAVKTAGFKLAFIGGYRSATKNDDPYKIPRYPIFDQTSFNTFVQYVNN